MMTGLSREKLNMSALNLTQTAIFLSALMASQSASATSTTGPAALALASLVAVVSPVLSEREKHIMERLFSSDSNFAFTVNEKISIKADAVVCRTSNVDITSRWCKLTFGAESVNLSGRQAHELYATLTEAGVLSEGAAGSIFGSLSRLVCTIDPREIAQRSGGGAECTFDPGGPQ
jgi:hypothetical protein